MSTEPISLLDDIARMQTVDKRNMLRLINELPEQCETAMGIGRVFAVESLEAKPNVILITGVGDSAVAARMLAAAISDEIDMPVVFDRGLHIPKYIGEEALVIILDYGGKSGTALKYYKEARQRGAKVICVASGGRLIETASKDGTKVIKVPPSQPSRTAIGYLFATIVVVIERLGLASGISEKLSYAIKLMKNVRESIRFEVATSRNAAKQIAESLMGKLVVIYGPSGYRSAVANRWSNQISANSKVLAFDNEFSDVVSSSVSGWEQADKQCKAFAAVFLKDRDDKGEIVDLMNASKDLLGNVTTVEVEMKGSTTLERMLYGLYLGDYVSYYLALLYEVNPTSTDNATYLESRLAEIEAAE